MPNSHDHFREAERLEHQAQAAENQHARAALRRMAETSRVTAAVVAMIEATAQDIH